MTDSRRPGRYRLHRLGWTAFEDLTMQVLRVVLGETCTRFREGRDGGRDGWFHGVASGKLLHEKGLTGRFLVQCKHTSKTHEPLTVASVAHELAKVQRLARQAPCHYLLVTNREVTAGNDEKLVKLFESVDGVRNCVVLSETWIEDTIDAHPRLMRLVPRLYGIGDLSQILSFAIQQQTEAVLEDLAQSLRTFVPTESYRRSEKALHEHGFAVLVGPPASGKTAIAANLCMVTIAQDPEARVLRIERAEQFKETWSPADKNTTYWVDDVFGETTLDEVRLREWAFALEKLEAARGRGARFLFCTRDYILAAAERHLRSSKLEIIHDAKVRIDVTALTEQERDDILYNHIKFGDVATNQKRAMKKHLAQVARLPTFSPEIARRLGSSRFTRELAIEWRSLKGFFDDPVRYFADTIHGLSGAETAALALCLLENNAVPDPVRNSDAVRLVTTAYGAKTSNICEALEALEGSLVKRVRRGTAQFWQMHHPSMIEALQNDLTTKASKLSLYVAGARLEAIMRDTTTLEPPPGSRLLFLPSSSYSALVARLRSHALDSRLESIGDYLIHRASDAFFLDVLRECPALIDACLQVDPMINNVAATLAVRLKDVGAEHFDDARLALLTGTLHAASTEAGNWSFLAVEGFADAFPEQARKWLAEETEASFPSFERLREWHAQDLSHRDHFEGAEEALRELRSTLCAAVQDLVVSPDAALSALNQSFEHACGELQQARREFIEKEELRADFEQDQWKERHYEEKYEMTEGRFSDVDE